MLVRLFRVRPAAVLAGCVALELSIFISASRLTDAAPITRLPTHQSGVDYDLRMLTRCRLC